MCLCSQKPDDKDYASGALLVVLALVVLGADCFLFASVGSGSLWFSLYALSFFPSGLFTNTPIEFAHFSKTHKAYIFGLLHLVKITGRATRMTIFALSHIKRFPSWPRPLQSLIPI